MLARLVTAGVSLALLIVLGGAARAQQGEAAAAREALLQAWHKYDLQISAMLDKSQDQAFNVDNQDLHSLYFESRPLTRANVNGYQAFLAEKLRLTPAQQDHLYWVERRMYGECEKLWKRWQDLRAGKTP